MRPLHAVPRKGDNGFIFILKFRADVIQTEQNGTSVDLLKRSNVLRKLFPPNLCLFVFCIKCQQHIYLILYALFNYPK